MKVTEKLEITIRNETIRNETEQVTNYLGTRTNKDITDSSRSYFLRILYINGNWRKSAPSFEFTTTIGSSIYFKKRTSTAPQQRHGYVKTLQKDARWRINSASTHQKSSTTLERNIIGDLTSSSKCGKLGFSDFSASSHRLRRNDSNNSRRQRVC